MKITFYDYEVQSLYIQKGTRHKNHYWVTGSSGQKISGVLKSLHNIGNTVTSKAYEALIHNITNGSFFQKTEEIKADL